MRCPKCDVSLNCPCEQCVERRNGEKVPMWIWVDPENEGVRCSECGFEAGMTTFEKDWWEKEGKAIYEKSQKDIRDAEMAMANLDDSYPNEESPVDDMLMVH